MSMMTRPAERTRGTEREKAGDEKNQGEDQEDRFHQGRSAKVYSGDPPAWGAEPFRLVGAGGR